MFEKGRKVAGKVWEEFTKIRPNHWYGRNDLSKDAPLAPVASALLGALAVGNATQNENHPVPKPVKEIAQPGQVFPQIAIEIKSVETGAYLPGGSEKFDAAVNAYKQAKGLSEPLGENPQLDLIIKNGGRENIKYIKENISQKFEEIQSPILRQMLIDRFAAMFAVESQFNVSATVDGNGDGKNDAFGLGQITIDTAKSFGFTIDQLKHPKSQVEAGSKLLTQNTDVFNDLLVDEFETIKYQFFTSKDGSPLYADSFFQEYVRAPLTFLAYIAGSGTVVALVNDFLEKYGARDALVAKYPEYADGIGKDLFFIMVTEAAEEGTVKNFGPASASYWIQIEAYYQAMKQAGLL